MFTSQNLKQTFKGGKKKVNISYKTIPKISFYIQNANTVLM